MVKAAMAALAALYAAMNGTGKREASEVTLMIKPFPARLHCGLAQVHQSHVSEDEYLKLVCDFCRRKRFGGTEMTAPGVVDQDVEIASFVQERLERLVN